MRFKEKKPQGQAALTVYFDTVPEELDVPAGLEDVVRLAITETLRYEAFDASVEVSVTFCDGPYIRTLNAEYRERDSETDVLSFPIFDEEEEDPIIGETIPLGDIVLNLSRAEEQGAAFGHSMLREIAFLTVHSTLHLLGYDHERSQDRDEDMCQRQKDIILTVENSFKNTEGKDL